MGIFVEIEKYKIRRLNMMIQEKKKRKVENSTDSRKKSFEKWEKKREREEKWKTNHQSTHKKDPKIN